MRKYLKDHTVKALKDFDELINHGQNFGMPLDLHLRNYMKANKSCKHL